MLSDTGIFEALLNKDLIFREPIDSLNVQPSSIDLHLDHTLLEEVCIPNKVIVPGASNATFTERGCSPDGYVLRPKTFVIASTSEYIKLNENITGYIIAKSSLARIGLNVLPGLIDPGFEGNITLEIFSTSQNPILLRADMKIAQISFWETTAPATNPYGSEVLNSKYQGQKGATLARLPDA